MAFPPLSDNILSDYSILIFVFYVCNLSSMILHREVCKLKFYFVVNSFSMLYVLLLMKCNLLNVKIVCVEEASSLLQNRRIA